MILIVDPKSGRGGGQVVLEELLHELGDAAPAALAMPAAGRALLSVPGHVAQHDTADEALGSLAPGEPLLVVSNANAALPAVHRVTARARRLGLAAASVAVVHNYPVSWIKGVATRHLLARMGTAIVVEPGLTTLRPDAVVQSWLSVRRSDLRPVPQRIVRTGHVKAFARPDASKGLHLLPPVFDVLEQAGFTCEVALGSSLTGGHRYETRLRADLAPWLVAGRRDPSWLEPGDVFVVASTGGEAACLAAQEAMARGAVVVASRIGLMPYLAADGQGIRTFAIGDQRGAADATLDLLTLPAARFDAECRAAAHTVADRAGRWYQETVARLLALHADLSARADGGQVPSDRDLPGIGRGVQTASTRRETITCA